MRNPCGINTAFYLLDAPARPHIADFYTISHLAPAASCQQKPNHRAHGEGCEEGEYRVVERGHYLDLRWPKADTPYRCRNLCEIGWPLAAGRWPLVNGD